MSEKQLERQMLQPCDNVINKIDEYWRVVRDPTVESFEKPNSIDNFAEHYLSDRYGNEYGKLMYADLGSTTYQLEKFKSGEHMVINIQFLHPDRYEPITLYVNLTDLEIGHPSVRILEEQDNKLNDRPGRELSESALRGIALDLYFSM